MKKIIINSLLLVAIALSLYFLVTTVAEPILFKKEKEVRDKKVTDKLAVIRDLQEAHRVIKGSYASSFEDLIKVIKSDSFISSKAIESADGVLSYQTIKIPAIDSVKLQGFVLDSISYVPFSESTKFDIQTGILLIDSEGQNVGLESQNPQDADSDEILIKEPVVKVGTLIRTYMGDYADEKYLKYDSEYEPDSMKFFGSLSKPTIKGNW